MRSVQDPQNIACELTLCKLTSDPTNQQGVPIGDRAEDIQETTLSLSSLHYRKHKSILLTCAVTQADECRRRGRTKNQPRYKSATLYFKLADPIANQVGKNYCFFILLKFTTSCFFFFSPLQMASSSALLFRIIHKSRDPWGTVLHLPK
jgi:hypothetical protein